jgi:hypothetical protein
MIIGIITIESLICYRWVDISTCVQLVIEWMYVRNLQLLNNVIKWKQKIPRSRNSSKIQ